MSMDKIIANVYETRNYEMFNKLLGNRDVTEQRIVKIIESINNVGYVLNPCVINKKNEVIDGQGRIEALKRLGLPVHYVVDKNAGLEQCVQLNVNGTPWKTMDYINSYVTQGKTDYINLKELIDLFHPEFSIDVISYAVMGKIFDRKTSIKGLEGRNRIITGQFECDDATKESAYRKLEFTRKFIPISRNVNGGVNHFLKAIIFAAFSTEVNKERLYKKCFERQQEIIPFTSIRTALSSITKVYNHNNRGQYIDIEHEYVAHCEKNNPMYKSRWSGKEVV